MILFGIRDNGGKLLPEAERSPIAGSLQEKPALFHWHGFYILQITGVTVEQIRKVVGVGPGEEPRKKKTDGRKTRVRNCDG